MCGIVGYLDKNHNDPYGELINRAVLEQKHRGKDNISTKSVENCHFGHCRLAIVDKQPGSNQPFFNKGNITLFNGEIYNYKEIARLENIPLDLGNSDTKVLSYLLDSLGVSTTIKYLDGMYAVSHYDQNKQKISLFVDRFGIKPIYYVDNDSYFAWASEAKVLRNFIKKVSLDEDALSLYVKYRFVNNGSTLFRDIKRVMPGTIVEFSIFENKLKVLDAPMNNLKEVHSDFEVVLENSVKQTIADSEEIGVQLSGGLDSSLIALFAQRNTSYNLKTFSIGMGDLKWNEFSYSDQVADIIGSDHTKIILTPEDFVKNLKKVTYYLDEPITHPNTVPLYLLAREARKKVRVMLTGEGADELFLGYRKYEKVRTVEEVIESISILNDSALERLLKSPLNSVDKKRHQLSNCYLNQGKNSFSNVDIQNYLPHVLLRQDKTGMMVNLENRVPFLNNSVYYYSQSMDYSNKIGKYGLKTPIKELALKYFDEKFVHRKKCGFGLPINEWLGDERYLKPLIEESIESDFIKSYFHVDEISKLFDEHNNESVKHSNILFSVIALKIWSDIFILDQQHALNALLD